MILLLFDAPGDFEQRVRGIAPEEEVVRADRGTAVYTDALARASIITGRPHVSDLSAATALEWLQLSSAGADKYVGRLPHDVVLTNASGVYGVPTSEHAISLMLAAVRRIPQSVRAAGSRTWDADLSYDELYARTCGILGLGDIGSAIARRLKSFGMHVLALRRTRGHPPEYVDEVHAGLEGLREMLPRCDHVVNVLPGTDETHHMIDAEAFERMKPSAYFFNVGRGSTVDEAALTAALQEGRLAGAGLDVFETEPLPKESPLWAMDNVIITPHRGGSSPHEEARVADLFLDNFRRWTSGQDLRNVVDAGLGY